MTDFPLRAYHFGPRVTHVGGMASVIQTLVSLRVGADVVKDVPTWWEHGSHVKSGQLTARAVGVVLRLPRSSVLHVHLSAGGSFAREAAVLAAGRLRRMPRVITIHGHHFGEFSRRWPRLTAYVLKMANAVTVLSESDYDAVRRLVPKGQVELLPNPVPVDFDAGSVENTSELVLFAGEVGTRKGADVLHRAWPLVVARRPAATCIIVGPPTPLTLPSLAGLEIRGPVSPHRVKELIREARVVTLPSRGEVLPMILCEAMAASRPFVSTPVGGVKSLAAGGVLVPVGDHCALADAIVALLADAARTQALGAAGRNLCEERMAPEVIDARLRQLYNSCLSANLRTECR